MEQTSIKVNLAERSYSIVFARDLLLDISTLRDIVNNKQVAIISNETVAPIYLPFLRQAFADRDMIEIIVPDGEAFKTLATLEKIFDELLDKKFDRKGALCSLGGGVIGDMTGFAAACYRRGVDFYQIPTTLLAQVDAAIGGKTAVNHSLGKNMIGAFYQPKAVLIDISTLKTLPEREFRAGLAEVIKYGLIRDRQFLTWLSENAEAILQRQPEALQYIIQFSCRVKATIVAADEREQGERALLNLGHTFGHALEAATKYKTWLHGEAVAIGMAAAAAMSLKLAMINERDYQFVLSLLKQFGLPTSQKQAVKADALKQYLLQDKKVLEGQLRLILLKSLGNAVIISDFPEAILDETLESI